MRDVLVPVVRFRDCDVKVKVDVYENVLVLVMLGADRVSLGDKVENSLVKELWTVKFLDILLLPVALSVPVTD